MWAEPRHFLIQDRQKQCAQLPGKGREGGREGKEGGREEGTEGGREEGREGEREGGRKGGERRNLEGRGKQVEFNDSVTI